MGGGRYWVILFALEFFSFICVAAGIGSVTKERPQVGLSQLQDILFQES